VGADAGTGSEAVGSRGDRRRSRRLASDAIARVFAGIVPYSEGSYLDEPVPAREDVVGVHVEVVATHRIFVISAWRSSTRVDSGWLVRWIWPTIWEVVVWRRWKSSVRMVLGVTVLVIGAMRAWRRRGRGWPVGDEDDWLDADDYERLTGVSKRNYEQRLLAQARSSMMGEWTIEPQEAAPFTRSGVLDTGSVDASGWKATEQTQPWWCCSIPTTAPRASSGGAYRYGPHQHPTIP